MFVSQQRVIVTVPDGSGYLWAGTVDEAFTDSHGDDWVVIEPDAAPDTFVEVEAEHVRPVSPTSRGQRVFWPHIDSLGEAFARGDVQTLD